MGKIYFASDFHLKTHTTEREKRIVHWLDTIKADAEAVYLVGDVFDFWFEYQTVVPKGYVRFLGKLAELRDSGIPIYFFTGNHDMWMFRYFEEELGIPIYRKPVVREYYGKRFLIGHGDGLGPGDHRYKFLKKVFANPFLQWCFARIHPNLGIGIANFWSGRSRKLHPPKADYLGDDKEWLVIYANKKLDTTFYDYFIFGHRHLPLDVSLKNNKSRYINLGDWIRYNTYAVFDGQQLKLEYYNYYNDE